MATNSVHRVGDGNVTLKLDDGEELILKPSWGAASAISRQFGGISGAVERVARLDMDVTVQVIMLGLGYNIGGRKPPPDLAERIWATGFTDNSGAISEIAIKYLQVLANGGRPVADSSGTPVAADGSGSTENPSMTGSTNAS